MAGHRAKALPFGVRRVLTRARVITKNPESIAQMLPNMEYRPDIDGLRALAVMAVVLFHADMEWASGGYVGVDVFFVLSGYLITGVIISGLDGGRFTLARFYERRVRRLLPAALTTIALTGAAGLYVMPDTALKELGGSVVYASVSLANVFFWLESGYFDSAAMFKPLLHAWSLGVEEQFYMVWPGLLLLLHSRRARRVSRWIVPVTLVALGGVSLWGAIHTVESGDVDSAFYLPHLRVWEFALGALLWWSRVEPGRYVREVALLMGLAMIVVPVGLYSQETVFPGATAIPPCLGTALIIWANNPRYAGSLLRNRVAVFIGKVSYSFYLVHWPVIVLYRNYRFEELSDVERWLIVVASFGLAVLLWKTIEERFRRPERLTRSLSGAAFALCCAGVALVITVVGANVWANGLDRELTPANRASVDYLKKATAQADELTLRDICYLRRTGSIDVERCLTPSERLPDFLVLGDSYAASMYIGMRKHFRGRASVHLVAATSCRPIRRPTTNTEACASRNKLLFGELDLSRFEAVFLVGAFDRDKDIRGIPDAVRQLRARGARDVFVLGPPMSYKVSVQDTLARFGRGSRGYALAKVAEQTETRFFESEHVLGAWTVKGGARYVSLLELLCPDGTKESCTHTSGPDGQPLIRDTGHLTADGAAWILSQLEERGAPWAALLAH